MKTYTKSFQRSISFFVVLTLLFQSLILPFGIAAVRGEEPETTEMVEETVTPTVVPTPEPTVTEESTPSPTPEAEPTLDVTIEITPTPTVTDEGLVKVEDPPSDEPICGDNVIDEGEQCDGTDLGGLPGSDFTCNKKCELELIVQKVTICHRTDSHTNPYIINTPDKSGDVHGHDEHDGDIWYPGIPDHSWGDIIPPFYYIGGFYPGKNWTTDGQAILENGCNIPPPPAETGTITIIKDANPDDSMDFSFTGDLGDFILDDDTDPTFSNATTSGSLTPGTYAVTESFTNGWTLTNLVCTGGEGEIGTDIEKGTATIALLSGEHVTCTFTNTKTVSDEPKLIISKFNDATGVKAPGDSVGYTIKVKAHGGNVKNVKVTDLLPSGFVYRPGTGMQDGVPATFEHEYASPGTWILGDMADGQEITLTLLADISTTQKQGTYRDIALAYGCNTTDGDCAIGGSNNVLAQAVNPGYVQETFVGTEVAVDQNTTPGVSVNVVREEKREEKKEERVEVLGASTTLPSTGSDTKWLILGFLLLTSGGVCIVIGTRMYRRLYA